MISIGNMVLMGLTVVVLLGALLGGVLYLRAHAENWFSGLIGGLLSYMTFGYIFYILVLFLIGKIAPLNGYFEEHRLRYEAVSMFFSFVFEALAIIFGVKLLLVYNRRRNAETHLGHIIGFALGVYAFNLLVGQLLSYCTNYIMYAQNLNAVGIDKMVETMMQENEGVDEETVRTFLASVINDKPAEYLLAGISNVLKMISQMSVAALAYGVFKEKLPKICLSVGVLFTGAFYLPNLLSLKVEFPFYVSLIFLLLLLAGTAYYTLRMVKEKMPEELNALSKERKKAHEALPPEQPKMPKIVMPKD